MARVLIRPSYIISFSLVSFLSITFFHGHLLNDNAAPKKYVLKLASTVANMNQQASTVANMKDIGEILHSTSIFSNTIFFQDHKTYDCTDLGPKHLVHAPTTEAPVITCLGGKESWGRCDRGYFLCEQKLLQDPTVPMHTTIRFGTPFSFDCIDNVCRVFGFRYDPAYTSSFCSPGGLCFGCYASRKEGSSDHFCQAKAGPTNVTPHAVSREIDDEVFVYIPDSPPLNLMMNGRDAALVRGQESIRLLAMTSRPDENCAVEVNQTAILMFLDGGNPFHHLLMVFRRVFAALVTLHVNSDMDALTDCVFVAWRGTSPERYFAEMSPFDRAILNTLCRGGLIILSNQSGPVCFAQMLIGSTPGGWDMNLDQNLAATPVNFAGVTLARLILESALGRGAAASAAANHGGLVLVVRRGRRGLVNEDAVRLAIEASVAPAAVRVLNFDLLDFRAALGVVSGRLVMAGVHGAALTNLIFLPPSAALVEVTISPVKNEYLLLARSFGKRYYAHPHLIPTDTHLPDLRDRRVTVDRVPDLGRLCATALARAERLSRQPACC